ncbi:MAG: hypothetical protein HZC17_07250 [Candidatus Omnitrophica bacterium]|nr:hypothetical protein [Candidatus Omnitrophota bacterium]
MMIKKLLISSVIVFGMLIAFFMIGTSLRSSTESQNRTNQIFLQEGILKEGDRLVERGLYSDAMLKYEEGLDAKFISKDEDERGPIVRKIRLSLITGNYQKGLDEISNLPKSVVLDPEFKMELEALQNSAEINSKQPVYDYIGHLNQKYQNSLPPQNYDVFSPIPFATILRLYDTIGDHDAGIAYIDMCMKFFKEQDIKKYGQYKPGHADEEYLKVREAFEQDKKEGTKGRATKALIQSDYFPW